MLLTSSCRFVLALASGAALTACGPAGTEPQPVSNIDPSEVAPMDDECGAKLTSFPGDCQAPPPVDPSKGVVAHYGPADYDDPEQMAEFVIPPGGEVVDCAYSLLPNDDALFYDSYDVHSRPGAHHVILYALTGTAPDGYHDDCALRDHGSRLLAVLQGGIRGSVYHYPPSGQIPPDNAGLATELAPHQVVAYELHAINATGKPLLRENWTVIHRMPKEQVTATVGQIAFNGGLGMHIAPHSKAIVTNSCTLTADLGQVRVVDFFGHMHAHGTRFSAWAATKDATGTEERKLIYESYDWSALDLIELNDSLKNTPVTYAGGVPGGMSGELHLSPGDRIDYECAMDNDEEFPLEFRAKALTGEMCNLFGSFTPGSVWSCVGD